VSVVVPDASVLLKWVLSGPEEDDQAAALELRDRAIREEIELAVPSLWLFEVGNLLARRIPGEAPALLAALVDFGLREPPLTEEWRLRALALTGSYGVTFYDAAYHALALVLGGVFVTADARYLGRAGAAGSVVQLSRFRQQLPAPPDSI